MKNGKGILEYGGRATKKFSIEFIAENQIIVKSHIGLIDIIIIMCTAALSVAGMMIVFAVGEIKAGVLCSICSLILCVIPVLFCVLPWNSVDKVLKKDFVCTRVK